jgi:hypothetical protein
VSVASCKDDREARFSAGTAIAEPMLSRQRSRTPVGSALSSLGQIVPLGGLGERAASQDVTLSADLGAANG